MKHLTIVLNGVESNLTKDFINYLSGQQHKIPINLTTYRTKPQFKPGDVVVAERVLSLQTESEEKRFDSEKITPLAKDGAYVFLLSEFMDDFGMVDFGTKNKKGLTGIIFKNHAGRLDPLQFRGYNGIFTRTADWMLGSYLMRDYLGREVENNNT